MTNSIVYKCFVVIVATVFLFSCSDDEDANIDFIEIPSIDLGVYDGVLSTVAADFEGQVINGETFVTLTESGPRLYRLDFNDDIPPVTDIQFFIPDDSFPSGFFRGQTESMNFTMSLLDLDEDRVIFIDIIDGDNTGVTFTGRRPI